VLDMLAARINMGPRSGPDRGRHGSASRRPDRRHGSSRDGPAARLPGGVSRPCPLFGLPGCCSCGSSYPRLSPRNAWVEPRAPGYRGRTGLCGFAELRYL